MSVSVVMGPVTSPMSLLQGDEDEHADPAPVTAEPQETRSRLAVSSAGIYSPTTATTTTWAGTGSPAATPTVNATASSNARRTRLPRRTRLLRHPEQDRVGRSPAVIHFTECLRSVGVICRPASSTVPGWKTGPSTTRPIPATSSGRSSSHCCRRRGPAEHPRQLRDVPTQPSGRCDETGSAALSTNTWRSHEVTRLSAPTPGARPSAARRCRTTG